MRMRKLIWVRTSRKSLIVPNEFSQSLHSVSPKIRFIPSLQNIYQSCNDTPPDDDTQFWDVRISSIDYKNTSGDTQKMQQISG